MKKHYIYIASNDSAKTKILEEYLCKNIVKYYNCEIKSRKKYHKIYDFWDDLDSLTMEEQSNTLVIFDPGIYQCMPNSVSNTYQEGSTSNNYWHELGMSELYPWYELTLRYPLVTSTFLTFDEKKLFDGIKDIDKFCYINIKEKDCLNEQVKKNVKLFLYGLRTWFDPFGLRDYWREKVLIDIFDNKKEVNAPTEQKRKKVYCLEDELEYGMLDAYVSYKYGNNAMVVDSLKILEHEEAKVKKQAASQETSIVVIKDRDLRYRDMENKQDGRQRKELKMPNSVFSNRVSENNYEYITDLNKITLTISSDLDGMPTESMSIKKPLDNMYEFVEELNFTNKSQRTNMEIESGDGKGNHASPYLNMQLSKDMLEVLKTSEENIRDKIFVALLYLESYQILNKMAETTSLDILKKMHLAELEFVLSFVGIGKNQTIKQRKIDIEDDVKKLFLDKTNPKKLADSKKLIDSFYISFWDEAKVIYRKYEQFRAAEEANMEAMELIKW